MVMFLFHVGRVFRVPAGFLIVMRFVNNILFDSCLLSLSLIHFLLDGILFRVFFFSSSFEV
jgi:hypothetical protein